MFLFGTGAHTVSKEGHPIEAIRNKANQNMQYHTLSATTVSWGTRRTKKR